MANTAGQWHALIDCYGQHRRPEEAAAVLQELKRTSPEAAAIALLEVALAAQGKGDLNMMESALLSVVHSMGSVPGVTAVAADLLGTFYTETVEPPRYAEASGTL